MDRDGEAQAFTAVLLAAARTLVDGIQAGIVADGFDNVRPAHGFAFARLAPSGATTVELAEHLGVTKQAAAQLVDELTARGYVERRPHPYDGRARLVTLTDRGWAVTRAADAAAATVLAEWADRVGVRRLRSMHETLQRVAQPGPLRPLW